MADAETLVVSMINVSHRPRTTAEKLAGDIKNGNCVNGPMSVFLLEVPSAKQVEFAAKHDISKNHLIRIAQKFNDATGLKALLAP